MLFKLERVCCKNDTPTNMRSAGHHPRSYEQVTNTDHAELLLEMNRGRFIPHFNFTPAFELLARNPGDQSVTNHGQVSNVLVATPLVGTLLSNTSSISKYPLSSTL